jgi:hypothetical protein
MTVETADTQGGDMVSVAEGYRLGTDNRLAGRVRRTIQRRKYPEEKPEEENTAKDTYPCQRIGAGFENLRHLEI